jgi:hypothetical protein
MHRQASSHTDDHPHISIVNLALVYLNQRRVDEVENLELRVMEMRRRVLGHRHLDTLMAMANLAHTWKCCDNLSQFACLRFENVEGGRDLPAKPSHPLAARRTPPSYSFHAPSHGASYSIISNQFEAVTFNNSEADLPPPRCHTAPDSPPPSIHNINRWRRW